MDVNSAQSSVLQKVDGTVLRTARWVGGILAFPALFLGVLALLTVPGTRVTSLMEPDPPSRLEGEFALYDNLEETAFVTKLRGPGRFLPKVVEQPWFRPTCGCPRLTPDGLALTRADGAIEFVDPKRGTTNRGLPAPSRVLFEAPWIDDEPRGASSGDATVQGPPVVSLASDELRVYRHDSFLVSRQGQQDCRRMDLVSAWSREGGRLLWSRRSVRDRVREEPSTAAPLVVDDLVVVCRTDGLVLAFDGASGAERWRLKLTWTAPGGGWLTGTGVPDIEICTDLRRYGPYLLCFSRRVLPDWANSRYCRSMLQYTGYVIEGRTGRLVDGRTFNTFCEGPFGVVTDRGDLVNYRRAD